MPTFREKLCSCGSNLPFRDCCGRLGPLVLDQANPNHIAHPRMLKVVKSWQTTHGYAATFDLLKKAIMGLDARALLIQIAHANRSLESAGLRVRDFVSKEALALLGKYTIFFGALKGGVEPTPQQCNDLILMCNDIASPRIEGSDEEQQEQIARFFIQISQGNDLDRPFGSAMARTVLLYDELAKHHAKNFDIPGSFSRMAGMSVLEFLGTAFGSYCLLHDKQILRHSSFKTAKAKNAMALAEQYLKLNSATIEQIREEFTGGESDPFTLNPLLNYPLIRLGDGEDPEFVCPVLCMVLEKATNGIYHMMWTRYKGDFGQTLGYVFQDYVGTILKPYFEGESVIPEVTYGKEVRSTDWSIIEGRDAALFECKLKRLRASTKATAARPLLEEDLDKGIVQALLEMNRVSADIKSKQHPELKPLHRMKTCRHVCIFLDEMYLANQPFMRRLVGRLLEKRGLAEAGLTDRRYRIMSIEELENLLPVTEELQQPVTRILENWAIHQEFEYDSFRNYRVFVHNDADPKHKGIAERFAQVQDTISQLFFPNDEVSGMGEVG